MRCRGAIIVQQLLKLFRGDCLRDQETLNLSAINFAQKGQLLGRFDAFGNHGQP